MIPATCCTATQASNVKVSDPKSTSAVFANADRSSYRLIRFDGCTVKGEIACDWIVEKQDVGRIAVELKGSDVDHAALQIESALRYMRDNGLADLRVAGLIICSRYPSVDTKVQRLKQRLAKTFRAPLKVKTDGRNLSFEAILTMGLN
jgi:hypothetical protein